MRRAKIRTDYSLALSFLSSGKLVRKPLYTSVLSVEHPKLISETNLTQYVSPLTLTTDYYFGGIPKYVRLSSLVYGTMYTDPKFTGYLRSFKIDGVPKYPDYRVGLSELSLG